MKHLELNTGPCQCIGPVIEKWDDLLPERIDFPQEVFYPDGVAPRDSTASLEKVTMNDRASSKPAPDDFPQGLLFAVLAG